MKAALAVAAALLAAGCVSQPTGPNVRVMPAPYKPFEVFTADDTLCRSYADGRVGLSADQVRAEAVQAATVGAVVGAAAGGLISGGHEGAAAGAGIGLVGGALSGANASEWGSWNLQRRYDWSYAQCMYAKGNQVPGFAPVAIPSPPPPPPPRQPSKAAPKR